MILEALLNNAGLFCLYNQKMRKIPLLGIVLIGLSLVGLIVISLPVQSQSFDAPLMLEGREQGSLTITTPVWIKTGDQQEISLQIHYAPDQKDDQSNKIDLISRLETGGLEISPRGEGSLSLPADHTIGLRWLVRSIEPDRYDGTLWLFHKNVDQKDLLLAKQLAFSSHLFLGLTYPVIRIIFICTAIFGVLLCLPYGKIRGNTVEKS